MHSLKLGSLGAHYKVLGTPDDCPIEALRPLADYWYDGYTGSVPDYKTFDVLDLSPILWKHLFVVKTVNPGRRLFYDVLGDAIDKHNGFPGNKRFLADMPMNKKSIIAREICRAMKCERPVFSTSEYTGHRDYLRRIYRVIAPFKLAPDRAAWVGLAFFSPVSGQEKRLEDTPYVTPDSLESALKASAS